MREERRETTSSCSLFDYPLENGGAWNDVEGESGLKADSVPELWYRVEKTRVHQTMSGLSSI